MNGTGGGGGYHSKGAPLNIVQEEFKESKLQMEGIGNAEVYFVDEQDDSYSSEGGAAGGGGGGMNYGQSSSSSDTPGNFIANVYKQNSTDYGSGNSNMDSGRIQQPDHGSESKAPVGSIEGPVSQVNYYESQGV